jgi:hypothetical protein
LLLIKDSPQPRVDCNNLICVEMEDADASQVSNSVKQALLTNDRAILGFSSEFFPQMRRVFHPKFDEMDQFLQLGIIEARSYNRLCGSLKQVPIRFESLHAPVKLAPTVVASPTFSLGSVRCHATGNLHNS